MAGWYFVQNGVQAGPVEQEQLSSMLAAGQLPRDTMVWTEGLSEWVPAQSRMEFFDVAFSPAAMAASAIPSMPRRAVMASGEYAGFWKRVLASIIDGILLFGISFGIGMGLGLLFIATGGQDFAALELMSNALGAVVGWLYFAAMESSKLQATPGKMALGIIVTDTDGHPISFLRATGRHFAKYISMVILFIGFIMVAFTERKQGLHDMLAGCLVVNKA
jgi:uncharacterized RDD family membrane protein YckC